MATVIFDREALTNVARIGSTYVNKSSLEGYGFNTATNRVISFKTNATGVPLALRTQYFLNNNYFDHKALKQVAERTEHNQRNAFQLAAHPKASATQSLGAAVPAGEYIMYSLVHKCSQYFKRGTSLGEALQLFKNRGLELDIKEVALIDPATGKLLQFSVQEVVTHTVTFK